MGRYFGVAKNRREAKHKVTNIRKKLKVFVKAD